MSEWAYEFVEDGGYDCMTDAFVVYDVESKQTICELDLMEYGQLCNRKNTGRVEEAEENARKIVEGVNKL